MRIDWRCVTAGFGGLGFRLCSAMDSISLVDSGTLVLEVWGWGVGGLVLWFGMLGFRVLGCKVSAFNMVWGLGFRPLLGLRKLDCFSKRRPWGLQGLQGKRGPY